MATSPPTCGSVQSAVCLLVRPTRSGIIPATKMAPPTQSRFSFPCGRRIEGSTRATTVEREDPDRDVDEEDPVPADVVGDEAAEGRPDEGGEAEDGPEEALVLAALGGREEVADDGQRDREERPGADPLDAPEEDQLLHRLAQAGQRGADQEDRDPEEEQRLAPEDVGELAVEGDGDRGGQQVDRDDPGVEVVAVQVGDDRRQRRPHDRLVEGAEEEGQEDRPQDLEAGAAGELDRRVRRRRAGRRPARRLARSPRPR